MRYGLAASFLQRQSGWGRSGACIWLFSSTQRTSACSRGFKYRATITSSLRASSGSRLTRDGVEQMGVSPCARQIRRTLALADANSTRHGARGPVSRVGWSGLRGLLDHCVRHRRCNQRRARGARSFLQQPSALRSGNALATRPTSAG